MASVGEMAFPFVRALLFQSENHFPLTSRDRPIHGLHIHPAYSRPRQNMDAMAGRQRHSRSHVASAKAVTSHLRYVLS